jgi:DNA-binding MarR family transcriptional regulator
MSEAKALVNELLVDIFNRILAIEGEELKKGGVRLSMNEIHVLEAVSLSEEPSMSVIAKRLGITVGSVTTSINTLVQKGYVTRRQVEEDRRKVLITLEQPALDALKVHAKYHEQMIDSVFADLAIEEDEILISSLKKVASYFRKS